MTSSRNNDILYAYPLIWKWLDFISVEYNMSCHMIYMYFIVAILVCSPNAVQRCQYNVNYVIFVWMMRVPTKAWLRLASLNLFVHYDASSSIQWCPYFCHWWFSLTVRKCKEYWKQYSSMSSCFVFYVCCMKPLKLLRFWMTRFTCTFCKLWKCCYLISKLYKIF